MSTSPPKPDLAVLRAAEELLLEQILALGDDPRTLEPHEISAHMFCAVHPDGSLSYSWRGRPVLDVCPETGPDGGLHWRLFTAAAPEQ